MRILWLMLRKKFGNWWSTVWKYQDFSATQILREINFEESKSSKNAIFTILEALCVKMAF